MSLLSPMTTLKTDYVTIPDGQFVYVEEFASDSIAVIKNGSFVDRLRQGQVKLLITILLLLLISCLITLHADPSSSSSAPAPFTYFSSNDPSTFAPVLSCPVFSSRRVSRFSPEHVIVSLPSHLSLLLLLILPPPVPHAVSGRAASRPLRV